MLARMAYEEEEDSGAMDPAAIMALIDKDLVSNV